MKLNRTIYPLAALAVLFAACDDDLMEWGTPDGQLPISASEIPLQLQEQINNYDFIKAYVQKHQDRLGAKFLVACAVGADSYVKDGAYSRLVKDNFEMYTLGNAMKHQSMVQTNGNINFATVDKVLQVMRPTDKLYGHCFIWHTQQNQNYLKSLIAPEQKVVTTGNSDVANVVTNGEFETDLSGWDKNGCAYEVEIADDGYEGKCAKFIIDSGSDAMYKSQFFWSLESQLELGKTYKMKFYAKADGAQDIQPILQNGVSGKYEAAYGAMFSLTNSWTLCEWERTISEADLANGYTRAGIQIGGTPGNVIYIDNFEFGEKQDVEEDDGNLLTNPSFEDDLEGWNAKNGADGMSVVEAEDAIDGKKVLKVVTPEAASNFWDSQIASPNIAKALCEDKTVNVSFWIKASGATTARVSFNGLSNQYPWLPWTPTSGSWTEFFEIGTDWMQIDIRNLLPKVTQNDVTFTADEWSFNLDLGATPNVTLYLDGFRVEALDPEESETKSLKATTITYVHKSAEEKKQILTDAMETWIKGVFEHLEGETRLVGYDVMNECIADGGGWRGIDGVFGMEGDSEPTEPEDGPLTLNWSNETGNGHFYWGYYMGKDYGCRAFEFARKYANQYGLNDIVLYINDYNLETSAYKRKQLIEFVKYIDENNTTGQPLVDGIGTQMHISVDLEPAQIDEMFIDLAATGKMVRVTELDIKCNSATPSEAVLQKQADLYQYIVESFIKNVPEAQRGGITIWGVSDDPDEHVYWIPDDAPNLFDAKYNRKLAYKGFCDGIAGYDIATDFSGADWANDNYNNRTEYDDEIEAEKEAEKEQQGDSEEAAQ